MGVSVMNIREMGMLVCDRRVTMKVRMRFGIVPIEFMPMLMMFIMTVRVFMFKRLMHMIMFMRLR
jgi:hypothetical protein